MLNWCIHGDCYAGVLGTSYEAYHYTTGETVSATTNSSFTRQREFTGSTNGLVGGHTSAGETTVEKYTSSSKYSYTYTNTETWNNFNSHWSTEVSISVTESVTYISLYSEIRSTADSFSPPTGMAGGTCDYTEHVEHITYRTTSFTYSKDYENRSSYTTGLTVGGVPRTPTITAYGQIATFSTNSNSIETIIGVPTDYPDSYLDPDVGAITRTTVTTSTTYHGADWIDITIEGNIVSVTTTGLFVSTSECPWHASVGTDLVALTSTSYDEFEMSFTYTYEGFSTYYVELPYCYVAYEYGTTKCAPCGYDTPPIDSCYVSPESCSCLWFPNGSIEGWSRFCDAYGNSTNGEVLTADYDIFATQTISGDGTWDTATVTNGADLYRQTIFGTDGSINYFIPVTDDYAGWPVGPYYGGVAVDMPRIAGGWQHYTNIALTGPVYSSFSINVAASVTAPSQIASRQLGFTAYRGVSQVWPYPGDTLVMLSALAQSDLTYVYAGKGGYANFTGDVTVNVGAGVMEYTAISGLGSVGTPGASTYTESTSFTVPQGVITVFNFPAYFVPYDSEIFLEYWSIMALTIEGDCDRMPNDAAFLATSI